LVSGTGRGFGSALLQKHKRWLQALDNLTTMTRTTILYLTLLLGIGCINKPETSQSVGAFSTVYDTLEQFQILITLTDEKWHEMYKKHIDKYGIGNGWELLNHPFAKLSVGEKYKAIIFVSTDETGSPTVVTIDKGGNPIDTLFLLGDSGGNDPWIWTTEMATINKDLTIELLDSVSIFDVDTTTYERIANSKKIKVTKDIYKIRTTGEFEKIR
jgi:hypothetical protein